MTDSEIIELFLQRSEHAIRETERKYGAYCYAIAQNILCEEEDAKECVNDTYYRAWTSIPPTVPQNLRVWLAKVVRNISLNIWKKQHARKRFGGMAVLLDELEECIPDRSNIEQQMEADEIGRMISDWLRTLPEADRRIFLLRYFEGQSVQTIAENEHLEAEKISKKMFVLRGKLKNILEKEGVVV